MKLKPTRRLAFAATTVGMATMAMSGCLLAEPVRLPLVPPASRGGAMAWRGS